MDSIGNSIFSRRTIVLAAAAIACLTWTLQDQAAEPRPAPQATSHESARAACEALVGYNVPTTAIGLPTTGAKVVSATFVTMDAAGNDEGEYCKIFGAILPVDPSAPKINFEVNLPSNWNGKMLQLGGGGFDGTLVTGLGRTLSEKATSPSPIAQGYVTLGSDSGHQSTAVFDASFSQNNEAFRNFGGDQIKKTHDVALALIRKRYGRDPLHSYFLGGSQGGHEGFVAVQHYPQDYDGVVSLYPAYNVALLHLGANAFGKALYANGGAGWLNSRKIALLEKAVYDTCDGLDGVADGMISNVAGCQRAFTIQTIQSKLRCADGADTGDTCLSDAQIGAVQKIDSSFKLAFPLADGEQIFPRWSILEGAQFLTMLGQTRTPSHPPGKGDALQYMIGDESARYIFTGNLDLDSVNAFNPDDYKQRIIDASKILNTANPDISAFRDRGGKLLLLHGTIDEFITPYNTINYYNRLVEKFGQNRLDQFVRFYIVPGYGHGYGIFDARWDPLAVLDAWVTKKEAPSTLTAMDGNKDANRSRPLCVYPSWPKYNGSGNVNAASSFRCVMR